MEKNRKHTGMILGPNLRDRSLVSTISGQDEQGKISNFSVIEERPLSIFLNSQEIVTAMTIGDYPEYLALGFLRNQNLLRSEDQVTRIDYDEDVKAVIVRTETETNYEQKLKRKIRTSGCAVGTVFGDMMESIEEVKLPLCEVRTSWLYALSREINQIKSLYLEVGAIHGTVLCKEDRALVYMEDVGRHNAVDKISGWMFHNESAAEDKILYTTGRLTSEMIVKCANMGIPVLVSRSGFTAWGVELAKATNMTLIGRLRGNRFTCLSGADRLVYDVDIKQKK